jgi:hypothetical protein
MIRSICPRQFIGLLLPLLGMLSARPAAGADAFDYFQNSWSVIGLKDYDHGTRLTPQNELLLGDKSKVRLRFGESLARLSRQQTKRLLDGWLPVVLLSAEEKGVRYDFTLWATPLPSVNDWQKAFDWPTEGENFLNWILIRAHNTGSTTAKARVTVERIGAAGPGAAVLKSFTWSLGPDQASGGVVRVPYFPVADQAALDGAEPQVWLERTSASWKGLMAKAARITVPCEKATQTLLAAHVCQLIANDHGAMHGGEGFYDEFYIRDGGYQIMELEEAGLFDAAGKAIVYYLRSQRPDGRFETQKGQFDANGQAVWVLWQYFKITGDRAWLAEAYPAMRRAVAWTMKARREAPADSPYAGVLPAAVADGEFLWDGKHHIVGYDLWNLRGILCTADAARILGREAEAAELGKEAAEYRTAIDAAWKRTGVAHVPPSWEKAGTHWGNTETLWPTEIFAASDSRVGALLDEVRLRHGGGFVEGTIRWLGTPDAIHPYMSAYTTMASLVRGEDEKVAEEFDWYLLHSSATHAFPEGIYFKRRFAWSDTIPHVTGASNYALLLRHMLIHERGDELHLLPAIPDWWLEDGKEIGVERAPTHFGPMSFRIRGSAGGVVVTDLELPQREPPRQVILHLPRSRPLKDPALKGVEVALRADQKKRWDYPTVVSLYEQAAPPLARPIPGLVELPLAAQVPTDRCRMLDLASLANTDPFTAPFGVPNPGKFLFTGMPVGEQVAGGVPFRLIDPARNRGHGLVVLHSPHAPKDRTWPKEVVIPVNAKGRRAFFLGNVHGWAPDDPGTGEWGAVAEYVIRYADGQTQNLPLITGRTIDEWTDTAGATDALCGLKGTPWHLNVVGVALRDVPVDTIVFRDLGTPAAPVLAAVTLEN